MAETLCLGLLLCVTVASAWLFGGALPDHQSGFSAATLLAVAAGLVWVVASPQLPRVHGLVTVLGLGVALATLQLIPLRDSWRMALSPGTASWQQRLMGEAPTGLAEPQDLAASRRRALTLYPESSRQDLARLLVPMAVFAVASVCLGSAHRQRTLSWLLAGHGALLALFGMVQQLTFNGKLFWTVTMEQGGSPFGSFVNRNHAAAYLNLCLAVLVALLGYEFQTRRAPEVSSREEWRVGDRGSGWLRLLAEIRGRRLLLVAWGVLMFAAVFLSLSRGAVLSLFVAAMAVLAAVLFRRGARRIGLVIVLASVLGAGIAVWFGQAEQLRQDLAELQTDWRAAGRGRLEHWHDAIRMVPDVWRFGSGLGTYRYIYPLYESSYRRGWFYHAENQYLEALIDGGVGGLCLMLSALLLALWAVRRAFRSTSRWRFCLGLGGLFALVATAVHAAFDFNLYMPANGILLALWTGLLFASRGLIPDARTPTEADSQDATQGMTRRRLGWSLILLACVGGLGWSTAQLDHTAEVSQLRRGLKAAKFDSAEVAGDLHRDVERLASLANGDSDACSDLAHWHEAVFRRATVRALQAQFSQTSNTSLLWDATSLIHVHGRWQAARRAGTLGASEAALMPMIQSHLGPAARWYQRACSACPLRAENFLGAAVLAGILGTGDPHVWIDRAVLVAPHDPETLFQAGLIVLQLGDTKAACHFWNRCLRSSADYVEVVIRSGGKYLRPAELVSGVFANLPLRPSRRPNGCRRGE